MMFSQNRFFVILALVSTALSSIEFVNHGTVDGWSSAPFKEDKGVVTTVDNVAFPSTPGTSIKFEQTYDPNWPGRFHSEVNYTRGYHRNQSKYYTFAFRLHSEWEFSSQSYNLGQFIADFTDTHCDDASPTTMIWLFGNTLRARIKYGQLLPGKPCPPSNRKWDCNFAPDTNCQPIKEWDIAKGIQAGRWYKVTWRAKWRSDATGEFQAWVDGVEALPTFTGATTLLDDGREFQFRVGLYANGWYDDKKLVGSQSRRQLWIDEVVVGSAPADVGL